MIKTHLKALKRDLCGDLDTYTDLMAERDVREVIHILLNVSDGLSAEYTLYKKRLEVAYKAVRCLPLTIYLPMLTRSKDHFIN